MSDHRAIAAVTETLVHIIRAAARDFETDLPQERISAFAPDVIEKKQAEVNDGGKPRINLYLYLVDHNAAWQNTPLPTTNGQGQPPVALTLYYLLTAYEGEDVPGSGQTALGLAMRALHDRPILSAGDFPVVTSNLPQQIERVKITRQPLNIDEMSKLWSSFQSKYRTSVAYRVDTVLIESLRGAVASLPVLSRSGRKDRGVIAQGSVFPPFPTLEQIILQDTLNGNTSRERLSDEAMLSPDTAVWPLYRNGFRPKEVIELRGQSLSQSFSFKEADPLIERKYFLRLRNDHLPEPIFIQVLPDDLSDERLMVDLPDFSTPDQWVPGIYSVALAIQETREFGGATYLELHVSNELPIALVPQIVPPMRVFITNGVAEVTLSLVTSVRRTQRVSLFLDSREIAAQPLSGDDPISEVTFVIRPARPGTYRLRLRVDGVDSELITLNERNQPAFDENARLVLVEA